MAIMALKSFVITFVFNFLLVFTKFKIIVVTFVIINIGNLMPSIMLPCFDK